MELNELMSSFAESGDRIPNRAPPRKPEIKVTISCQKYTILTIF